MPLFSNPFDVDVEKATSEMNTTEDWAVMLDICDKAKESQMASKNCLKSIMKRVFNKNPHVALQALSLLNACVKNSGKTFQLEIASRDFITDCKKIISDENASVASRKVSTQLKQYIKNWSENEFKSDSALSIIPSFYKMLKEEGISFSNEDQPKSKKFSKDPNVVQSQEEEEDIAKAIALSLKESEKVKTSTLYQPLSTASSIYPSVANHTTSSANSTLKPKEPKKVRALYDFEAVEDNELTFKAGEIIGVTDDSDLNWWKGVSWRGEGLFPANFVTFSLEPQEDEKQEVVEQNYDNIETDTEVIHVNKIDEDKINTTLAMLRNADPSGDVSSDPENMVQYEEHCRRMLPLIDQELEKIDREHSRLTEMNEKLIRSLELYHTLMAELPSASKILPGMAAYQQQQLEQQMMMMQLQQQIPHMQQTSQPGLQQQASVTQFQSMPILGSLLQHVPTAQFQTPDQISGNQITVSQNFQQNQQPHPTYPQPYNYTSPSFAEVYVGTNGHQISINSMPAMTGVHLPSEDPNIQAAAK